MIYKCKICGGSLDVKTGERTAVCEYCGVRQSIPSFIDIKAQEINNIANNYLAHNEFDKAENLYAQILIDNKSDADAYWNILMCRYGVTYVNDPASGKYIPTCNRTLYAPIFNDDNYKNAIKYADEKQKTLFESNAKIIDDIQKGILSVSSKEKPFDIFISYKETAANGARTKESVAAQELYEKLTAEGYKVFFSRITLEDKIGTEYEPYIYAALTSSKVMLTVSSSKGNLESVWVKNEWSRYMSFAVRDSSKTLIPLCLDMDKADLPDEFALITAYDMRENGFEQELIRGIKKLIPLPAILLERRKKINKIIKRAGIIAVACAVVCMICAIPWFMKLPAYNTAMQLYYDKNYPEATWAFAELGNYRNSDKMKEKCECSWRKSVATVVLNNDLGRTQHGKYYVNQNGEVKSFSDDYGDLAENINMNEHGKTVSIALGYPNLYALHEDGYVDNVADNNGVDDCSEWHNIIQISPLFNSTNIALRSDGQIIYSDLKSQHIHKNDTDEWLFPASKWNSITSIDYCIHRSGNGSLFWACLAGVKKDGDLNIITYSDSECSQKIIYDKNIIDKFHDVKKVHVFLSIYNKGVYLNILALTKSNDLLTYLNGKFSEYNEHNIIDAYLKELNDAVEVYYLTDKGEYKNGNTGYCLLKDVISVQNHFFVTRTGSIFDNISQANCNEKAIVYDEWIGRLK